LETNLEGFKEQEFTQNETKNGGKPFLKKYMRIPKKLKEFVGAMGGIQWGILWQFAKQFGIFQKLQTLWNVGGSGGFFLRHMFNPVITHICILYGLSFDLPSR